MAGACVLQILLTILLLSWPAPSSTQRMPSYTQLLLDGVTAIKAAQSNSTLPKWLKDEWPLFSSPTLFHHELVKAAERWARNGNLKNTQAFNVSAACIQDLGLFIKGVEKREKWAVQAIDSMGKPPPNLKGFNFKWPGAFKECRDITVMNTTSQSTSPLFSGKYCTATVTFVEPTQTNLLGVAVSMGICVPDSCSSMDLTILMNVFVYKEQIKLPQPPYAICQEPSDYDLNNLAYGGIAVVSLFALLMVVGTLVDLYFRFLPTWRLTGEDSVNRLAQDINYHHDDDVPLLGAMTTKSPEPGFVAKLLIAFSVYTNGAKLLSTEQTAGTLQCVHGIRFLSMTWVVLGHTYLLAASFGENLFGYFMVAVKRWTFQGIINATVSVDSFFVLSGLLVAYLSLKELKRTGGKINWLKFYFHRFWRLTPPYMLVIFIYVSLEPYMGSGPLWIKDFADRDNCKTNWWTNLLYINNFVHPDKVCLGQSWYLANDMQFYILSPLIFVPLFYKLWLGSIVTVVFMLATTITPGVLTMVYHLGPGSLASVDATNLHADSNAIYYVKPYNRMGPYLLGMLTGYLLYRTDCKARINKIVNLACWAVATAVALAVLYGLYHSSQGHPMPLALSAFYNAMARPAWGAAVCWVTFACVTNNGGFVNTILSWSALVPLSRLTYCIYLIHIMVLAIYMSSRDSLIYYTNSNIVVVFLGILVVCYMISFVVSLAFEAPMLALEKLILGHKKRE